MRAIWVGVLGAALTLGLWASCGGDDDITPGDGGDNGEAGDPCTRTDECHQGFLCEAGHCNMVLPTLEPAGTNADMSCLGDNPPVTPLPGTVTATVYLEDFEEGTPVEGATIDLFVDNIVSDMPTRTIGPTDADGLIAAADVGDLPTRGQIAYRVQAGTLPGGEVRTTIEYDVQVPEVDGEQVRFLSVSGSTYTLIETILGIRPDPALGVIAGSFTDCPPSGSPPGTEGENVEGYVVRLLNAAGEDCHALNPTQCYSRYFVEEMPTRIERQTYSSPDGLFGIVQVPPGEWTVEVRGRLTAATTEFPFDLLGRKVVRPAANAIVIVDVNPLATPAG